MANMATAMQQFSGFRVQIFTIKLTKNTKKSQESKWVEHFIYIKKTFTSMLRIPVHLPTPHARRGGWSCSARSNNRIIPVSLCRRYG
jgi:hypothetical protein